MADAKQNLDGKTPITPTPFDAHERVARVQHEEAPKQPGYAHSGLQVVDPEDAVTEYPKAVAHNDDNTEPVIANDKGHEAELEEAKADAALDEATA